MKQIKLGEIIDVKRGAGLAGQYYATAGDYKRLTLGNFNYPGGGFKENTAKTDIYYTGPFKSELLLKKGDIITPLTEQVRGLLGETATIPEDDVYILSGDAGLVVVDEEKANKRFVNYLISSPIVKKQLDASSQQTKIRHTSPDAIKNCEVWIPDTIEDQKKIADLLDAINGRISINNSICSDLEAMAKQLYDYWFVQFDFPDENGKPYKSSGGKMVWNDVLKREIPEGWDVDEIGKYVSIRRGISYSSEDLLGDGIPMINLNSFETNATYKTSGLKTYSGNYADDKKVNPYDLIVCATQQTSIDITGVTNVIAKSMFVPDIFESDAVCSMDVIILDVDDALGKEYLRDMINLPFIHKYISGFANGTKIKHLDINGLLNMKHEIPERSLVDNYGKFIMDLEKKKSSLIEENQELTSLRDFLLPMLMNGQVKVRKEEPAC